MESPVVVLGSTGQVGRALLKELGSKGVGLGRAEADLTKTDGLLARLEKLNPMALINAAAYTDVDGSETNVELAEQVNGRAPGVLARWAKERGIPLVHFSTDYVFPGEGSRPWKESDPTRPLNAYGKSKRAGEVEIEKAGGDYLIFRTSWVYDADGKNFLNAMLRLGAERDNLSVVDDQVGAPTFAQDLARATLSALQSARTREKFPSGIYHMTAAGETCWFAFANEIFAEARGCGLKIKVNEIRGISTEEYPTKAQRPKNSRMDNSKFRETFGFGLRDWMLALHDCMKERCAHAG